MPLSARTTVAVSLAALAACRGCTDLKTSREYPCTLDGGEGPQCPVGARCGLNRRCHSTSVAADYACGADGDCEAGWRCGLNGVCHARAPAPYACASDVDCEAGWRCACCGANRTCHSPDVGADYPCRTRADCEQGWHCGLEGICHDPSVGAAYACAVDENCEAGWRCGLDGICVDASREALRTSLYEGPLEETRVSPVLGGTPDLVASAQMSDAWLFAFVVDGGLTQIVYLPDGLDDAGVARAFAQSVPLDAPPVALAAAGARLYVADNQGLLELTWSLDGGAQRRLAGGAGARGLRVDVASGRPIVVGRRDDGAWLYDAANDGFSPVLPLPRVDGGTQQVFDVVLSFTGGWGQLVAATEEGLFAARYDGDSGFLLVDAGAATAAEAWVPTEVANARNARCAHADAGADLQVRVTRLDWAGDDGSWLLMSGNALDAGATAYDLYTRWGAEAYRGCESWDLDSAYPGPSRVCAACAAGDDVVDMLGWSDNMVSWCRSADGQTGRALELQFTATSTSAACTLTPLEGFPFDGVSIAGHDGVARSTHADSSGRLTHVEGSPGAPFFSASPLTLDRAPNVLFKVGERRWATSGPERHAYLAVEEPGVGFIPSPFPVFEPAEAFMPMQAGHGPLFPERGVEGEPGWVFALGETDGAPIGGRLYDLTTGDARLAAVFASSLGLPTVAVLASTADGGTRVIAAFGDLLASTDVTGPATATLDVKLAPRVFDPIRALTSVTVSIGDGGELPVAEGYALTSTGLFHFAAASALRWRADEVSAPPGGIALWADGAAGRVGYPDGTVLSLPSRAALSSPLPDAGVAIAYAQLCGQPFALTAQGLYRLGAPRDGGIGAWSREPLAVLSGVADPGFTGGGLDVDGDALLVTTSKGIVVQLTPPLSCP